MWSRIGTPGKVIILLARAPSAPGKTRLIEKLAPARARALREALFLDTLDTARASRVPVVVSFTPDDAREEMALLVGDLPLIPQRGTELGERMRHAMTDACATGAESVVLIGSDLPTLPPEHVEDAFAMLESGADLVLGPAEDGGFYLVAARRAIPDVFKGVEWSTSEVLARVVDRAHVAGLTVGLVRPWWDVDTLEDLRRVLHHPPRDVGRRVRAWYTEGLA